MKKDDVVCLSDVGIANVCCSVALCMLLMVESADASFLMHIGGTTCVFVVLNDSVPLDNQMH